MSADPRQTDRTVPLTVGARQCVMVRPEAHDLGPYQLRMWRITHPYGRQRLAGTANYLSADRAILVAQERGWSVLGRTVAPAAVQREGWE